MKRKTYETNAPKKDENRKTLKVDDSSLPNKMHFEVQLKTKRVVFEDRRKKAPKHKGKSFDEE